MTWFHLTLLSQVFLISYYFLSKKLLNRALVDPRIYGGALQLATGLIALPFALASGFSFSLTPLSLGLLALMGAAYTFGPSLYYTGLQKVDLSLTTILDSSVLVWTIGLGALLLNEDMSWQKIIGAGLILLAISLVAVKFHHTTWKPHLGFYELLLLISPFFYAMGAILDNRLLTYSNPASYLSVSFLVAGSCMLLSNIHRWKTVGAETIAQPTFFKTIFINGCFLSGTYLCIMWAYRLGGEVSRIYTIQQFESVLIPILGIIFLKERDRLWQKVVAIIIAAIGVWLVRG